LGARPLKRVIQKMVLDPLALRIVSGEVKEKDRINVDLQNGEIIFKNPKNLAKDSVVKEKVLV